MFLTETALLADVVLPTSNLYEKAGTVTNTYGDQQLVKKAGDRAGVRSDFELMVRLADTMGADPKKLVPFGRGVHADMGQTRGAQSGEADRHSVWLAAQNLEPKLSPFDPLRHSRRDPAAGARLPGLAHGAVGRQRRPCAIIAGANRRRP
jgi:NADH-quinone oxidoreductase subunit G